MATAIESKTPMLRQYARIKAEHRDTILFYRLGDFYEMFFDDAVEASKILDITLTSRNKGKAESVPLCGVPYHACQAYIAKLLAAGKKVAVCEQMEDPAAAKGVVKREVVRIITPGTVFEESALEADRPNYLAAVMGEKRFGLSVLELSIGHFACGDVEGFENLCDEILKIDPKELLIPREWGENGIEARLRGHFPKTLITGLAAAEFNPAPAALFEGSELLGKSAPRGLQAAGALWNYACYTQKGAPPHVRVLKSHAADRFLILDEAAQKHLELLATQDHEKKGSLFGLLDRTETPMGARCLRQWILYPLTDLGALRERQEALETILGDGILEERLAKNLSGIADLERLNGRIMTQNTNARDLKGLGESLEAFPNLIQLLKGREGLLGETVPHLEGFGELAGKITATLTEAPPLSLKEGGLIREEVDPELDQLKKMSREGKSFLAALESKERQATGIGSLKVKFNRVFGYYLEVTHAHREKVPPYFVRKQTLVNAERYITPELKEYEDKILGAEEKIRQMEYAIFCALREACAAYGPKIQEAAARIARLDTLRALAEVARKNRWVRPRVTAGDRIEIREGRHPIVEALAPESFVPNDLLLDGGENRFLMITGPNMAGKSTIMRQTALIVILAQIGSRVPAESAEIGIADRIFTRVGAFDRLSRGESTFMVEMVETAHILKEATLRSLVLIDEIGRGTSTYDGVAIAWSVAEHLHSRVKARTLFATHYHELIDLEGNCPGMKNFNIAVKEFNEKIIFLRKLVRGGTSKSYGVEVARLAGLPETVIRRAREILAEWESFAAERDASVSRQLTLFGKPGDKKTPDPILEELRETDLNGLTPLQALELLASIQSRLTSR